MLNITSISLDSAITATAPDNGNNGKVYKSNAGTWEWRFYAGDNGVLTISAAAGYQIVSAKGIVGTANYDDGTEVEFTITDGVVTFNNNGANFNIKSLTVSYKVANA